MKFKEMPYERVDYDKTAKKLTDLTERVKAAQSGEELWEVHQEYYQVYKDMADAMTIAHIRYDADTSDEFYMEERNYYDETGPKLDNLLNGYKRRCMNLRSAVTWKKKSVKWLLQRWIIPLKAWMRALSG